MMNHQDNHPSIIMNKLISILNNKTLQWQKYEGAVIGIYNLLLIQGNIFINFLYFFFFF